MWVITSSMLHLMQRLSPGNRRARITTILSLLLKENHRNSISSLFSTLQKKNEFAVPTRNCTYVCHRWYSRMPKSWFRLKKKAYDVVCLHEVSPKRDVPDFISKPDYAMLGVAVEQEYICPMNEAEIKHMRQSCSLAKIVLDEIASHIRVGITTDELDVFAHDLCINYGAYPSPLNYRGFPKSICTSVNNIACHGIPDRRKLLDGDVISIDISVFYNGYHGDCAATYPVGDVDEKGQNLIMIASQCLYAAIKVCHPNQSFCQIGKTISAFASNHGYTVVPSFCGHGIGTSFHIPPNILHYDNDEPGDMKKGMIFTIEPVISEGRPDIEILEDGWTAASEDESRSAQFEHTILITETGAEILTDASAFINVQQ